MLCLAGGRIPRLRTRKSSVYGYDSGRHMSPLHCTQATEKGAKRSARSILPKPDIANNPVRRGCIYHSVRLIRLWTALKAVHDKKTGVLSEKQL